MNIVPFVHNNFWACIYIYIYIYTHAKNSKAVAFADDLILAVRNETIRAAENISNIKVSKITGWSRNNKINFNEDKSKVIKSRKRKENKEINIYLNKPLQQVSTIKYLGIVIDNKFKFSEHISSRKK